MKHLLPAVSLFTIIFLTSIFAANELSVKNPDVYGSKKGYIEKATLVVEPFGSYVEQSLYLEYSERNQFTSNKLEIVHRFELPNDAVVNDMWLWIADSVMQAQMFDTWTARHLYDSVVATRYDPAFLAKTGTQYELRIYPLASGNRRKVKITFIVPTRWYGNQAAAELPLKMLLSGNSTAKPLEILFRYRNQLWGSPLLAEFPTRQFSNLADTAGYHYEHLHLDDISNLSSLNLQFSTEFQNGYYLNGYQDKSDSTYYQLGILPEKFFNLISDTSPNDVLVALDFSGSTRKNLTNKMPAYRDLIENSLKSNDNFKLLVSGNQKIESFTNNFITATSYNINTTFNSFENSEFSKAINLFYMPSVLFCDFDATTNWNFTNLASIATVTKYSNINQATSSITRNDIVAAYRQGFDDPITQETANTIISRLDTLFTNGGRFLTYYDYNREGREKLAVHYIQGLKVKAVTHDAVTLYRNPNGNIGMDFPESFTRNASYFLEFNDPDVKIELMDKAGNASVISKKIKNGLIVVTGIWSLRDDSAMKTLLGGPLLGVNSAHNPFTLNTLIDRIKQEYQSHKFTKVVLLSDSDSLISKTDASVKAKTYMNGFNEDHPKFYSINILDNDIVTPAYITDGQAEYYGSGYFLKMIADESNGVHMEKHLYDWPYIKSVFSPYAIPAIESLEINTSIDGGTGQNYEIREIDKLNDPNKPRFFLGLASANHTIDFHVSAKIEGADSIKTVNFTYLVPHDTSSYNKLISSMLGNEHIRDLFNATPVDTPAVVHLALKHNLLTDYTSLLALEPNDRFHFMKDPIDESGMTAVEDNPVKDSTIVSVYPNPFNSMTVIKINLKSISNVSATIYNILGERIKEFAELDNISGQRTLTWNGTNNYGSSVASGFYILRVIVNDKAASKQNVFTHKLVYLK